MKINIIATLLFALKASTASGQVSIGPCEDDGIVTWNDCLDNCKALANGRRLSARVDGGIGNISACYCQYGPNLDNSYTCTRIPDPLPPFPVKDREFRCNAYDINNQEECFAFCTKYKRLAKYVGIGNANVLKSCACQDVQGGPDVWKCTGSSNSYLRSS